MNEELWSTDGKMLIGKVKYSEKNLPLCSSQIPHRLPWDRTWFLTMRGWQLAA